MQISAGTVGSDGRLSLCRFRRIELLLAFATTSHLADFLAAVTCFLEGAMATGIRSSNIGASASLVVSCSFIGKLGSLGLAC